MKKIIHVDLFPQGCAPLEVTVLVGEGTVEKVYNISWWPIRKGSCRGYSLIVLFSDKNGVQKLGLLSALNNSIIGMDFHFEDIINPEVAFRKLRGIGQIASLCEMTFEELFDVILQVALAELASKTSQTISHEGPHSNAS